MMLHLIASFGETTQFPKWYHYPLTIILIQNCIRQVFECSSGTGKYNLHRIDRMENKLANLSDHLQHKLLQNKKIKHKKLWHIFNSIDKGNPISGSIWNQDETLSI